jgi:hypothetical protein
MSKRALFVIGTGRSGTTALYEFLCSHPDSAWISNYSQRFPPAALVHPRGTDAGKHRERRRWTIRPVEGYRTFDGAVRVDAAGRLRGRSPGRVRALRLDVWLHGRSLRSGLRPLVFVSKNTRNSRGVAFLDEHFPEARFVHLVRHPTPTVASLARVEFFPELRTGWRPEVRTFADAVRLGDDPLRLAAELWNWETSIALEDLDRVGDERVQRIRYEDLVGDPAGTLRAVCAFGELATDRHPTFEARAEEFRRPVRTNGTDARLEEIVDAVCGETARRLGYRIA